jgi:hypothetical protein
MQLEFKTRNQKQLEAAEYWIDNDTEQVLFGGARAGRKSFLGAYRHLIAATWANGILAGVERIEQKFLITHSGNLRRLTTKKDRTEFSTCGLIAPVQ